jgi:hypothetical protein
LRKDEKRRKKKGKNVYEKGRERKYKEKKLHSKGKINANGQK